MVLGLRALGSLLGPSSWVALSLGGKAPGVSLVFFSSVFALSVSYIYMYIYIYTPKRVLGDPQNIYLYGSGRKTTNE